MNASSEHVVDDIRQWLRDGLEFSQIVWKLERAGVTPPDGMKHWHKSAIVKLILAARYNSRVTQLAARRSARNRMRTNRVTAMPASGLQAPASRRANIGRLS